MSVYYHLVEFITKENYLLLPKSYGLLSSRIEGRTTKNGIHITFINDPTSTVDAFAFSLPVGYFNEESSNFAVGTAHLLSTGLENMEQSFKKFEFNRTSQNEGQSTTWSSLSNDLLMGLSTFWYEFTHLSNDMVKNINNDIATLTYNFMNNFHKQDWISSIVLKKLSKKPKHPYSRFPYGWAMTFEGHQMDQEVAKFYDNYYRVGNLSIAVDANLTAKANSNEILFSQISEILSRKDAESHVVEGKVDQNNFGLPFSELPRLIAHRNREHDTIKVIFQVLTNFQQEAEHEPVKFVTSGLWSLLSFKFHELGLVHHLRIYAEYFSDYALIHIKAYYTHEGKSRSNKIIATVLAAIKELKRISNEQTYAKLKEDSFVVYDTAPILSSKQLAEEFAVKVPRYGFKESFRATKTLRKFDSRVIDSIIDQLIDENMVVVIAGDLPAGKNYPGMDGMDIIPPLDLVNVLRNRVTNEFDFKTITGNGKNSIKAGSLILNGYFSGMKEHYHTQTLSKQIMDTLRSESESISFQSLQPNPYALNSNYVEEVFKEVNQNIPVRSVFKSEDNRLTTPTGASFYFRVNKLFPLPTTYLNMRFLFPLLTGKSLTASEVVDHHVKMLLISHLWKRRLSLIHSRVLEYNGNVVVEIIDNVITVSIYAPNLKFKQIFEDVLEKLNLENSSPLDKEYAESIDHTFRELLFDAFSFDQMQSDLEMTITRMSIPRSDIVNYLRDKHSTLVAQKTNPNFIFGLVEGEITKSDRENYLQQITRLFKAVSPPEYQFSFDLAYFTEDKINVLRFPTMDPHDSRTLMVMAVDLGVLSVVNYVLAHTYQILFEREFRDTFITRGKIADRVDTRVQRISNHMILELMVMGSRPVQEYEEVMEVFLNRAKVLFESFISQEWMEKLKKLTANKLRIEKLSVFDYAHEDAHDLYLSRGRYADLREQSLNILQDHITQEDMRTFVNQHIFKGKRLYFEQYRNPDRLTKINPNSSNPALRRNVNVVVRKGTVV
jgi:hypothetical protein